MGFIIQESVIERVGCVLLILLHHTCSGLEVTVPSSHVALFQTRTVLPCTFTVNNPPVNPIFLAIFWYFEGKQLLRYDNKDKDSSPGVSIDEQELKRGNASLSIHNVTITDQGTYKCLVIYSPERQHKEIQLNILAVPTVGMNKKVLLRDERNLVQCSVTDFFPRDITVRWLRNGQDLGSASEMFQMNADGTYNVNSSVTISPIEAKDNPVITCQVEHESLRDPLQDAFRVEYGAAPTVRVLSSMTPDGEEQIYVCEARGYSPEAVEINWLLDGKRSDPRRGSDNSLFDKEIYYRILLNKDKRPTQISCEVQHETLYSPITETQEVQVNSDCRRHCHFGLTAALLVLVLAAFGTLATLYYFITRKKLFQRFQVSHIHKMERWTEDKKVALYCVASNCTTDAVVTWTVMENGGEKLKISEAQAKKDAENTPFCSGYTMRTDRTQSPADKLYNIITALSFKPDISKELEVTCNFSCDGRNKERSLKCSWNLKKPEMSAPINLSLSDSRDVLCSVTLEKFSPRDIKIIWSSGVGHYQKLDTIDGKIIQNSDNTFNIKSECRVPGHLFKDPGFKVRVTWSHQSLDVSEFREVSVADFPWRPVMDEIIKPPLLLHSTEAKLQCTISGYFPGDLAVKWMRREAGKQELYEVSPSDKYKIPVMEITQQSDKTYTCTASLIVSVSALTEHGSEFICRVTHPTLVTPLEKRTGELSVTGIPVIRNRLQDGGYIILEVDSFYPQELGVTWERADSESGPYKRIPDSDIETNSTESSDGSYRVTSICEAMTRLNKMDPSDKYFKAILEHGALKSPEVLIFLRSRGNFSLISGQGKQPLHQVDRKIVIKSSSSHRRKSSERIEAEESHKSHI
ncbi:uncharacterized protein LOC142097312 [Mixophyes fleayi]|uniref:uncharacterized protein LOC142097312 n=1 Tax=Mixophyes fleayi TaxID=3061075 RepID=UPI003F4D966E